jgi:kynurenine formamidase
LVFGVVQDLQQALQKQNVALQPGDAVLINTGWGRLWGTDNARYMKGNPGIGVAAADWLVKQDPMLVGADNGPVEVSPNPDPQISLPVHQIMLVVNGATCWRTSSSATSRPSGPTSSRS